jgi:hypothetical protein
MPARTRTIAFLHPNLRMKLWINGIFYHLFLIVSLKSGALLIQLLMQACAEHNFTLMRIMQKNQAMVLNSPEIVG